MIANNAEKFSILICNLVLGHSKVAQSQVGCINLLVGGIQVLNKTLVGLVSRSLASDNLFSSSSGISNLSHDDLLVLLNLGLHLGQGIDLLLHLQDSIPLFPLQVAENRLTGNVGLLNIFAKLDNLSLTLLVELHLGNGSTAGLIISLTKLFNLTCEVRSLTLSLGTSLTFSLQLFFSSLNTSLQFLDVLLGLGHQRLLIIKFGRQHLNILLLVANGVLNVSLFSLKISNRVLGHLQIPLHLSLLLLQIGSSLLLLVQASFKLIQSGLKLRLDLTQMLDLLLSTNKVLIRLGLGSRQVLLFLVQFVDHLILFSNLVLQNLDGVVTVALLSLNLGDGKFNILNVLLDSSNAARVSLDLSCELNSGGFFTLENVRFGGQLHLGLSLDLVGLGLSVSVDRDAALFLSQLLGHGTNFILQTTKTGLKLGSLVKSSLVLTIGGIGFLFKLSEFLLRIGKTNESSGLLDDDKPSPISHLEILSEVSLGNLDEFSLISLGSIDSATDSLESFSLDESDPLKDQVITSLLKLGKSSGSEEDKGMSKSVSLSVETNLVHEGIGGSLVVRGGSNLSLSQASISHLVVRIKHPVWESTHTNSDSFQHTITGELVHDQWRLNISWLLVSVGHKTTDKVRSTIVEGGQQLSQGDKVDRGDSLATASLLLLLALVLFGLGWLSWMVFPEEDKQGTLGSGLEDLNNSVIDRVLVLLKPVGDVVVDNTSVVRNAKVGILVSLGGRLQEDGKLAKGSLQLLFKGLVSSLGEEGLLFKNGPDTHGLLKHDDGSLQVHTKVNHDPVNTFLNVLLLFNNEHVVVEELLELLVDKVDGNLFESIVLEDLETSNIQDSAEVSLLECSINEGVVTLDNKPLEETVKDGSGNTSSGTSGLLNSLTLGDPLGSDLDSWLAESLEQGSSFNSAECGHLSSKGVWGDLLQLSLVITTLLDVDNTSSSHDTSSQHVAVKLLLLGETKNVEGILSVLQLLVVINGGNSGFALGDVDIVIDVA